MDSARLAISTKVGGRALVWAMYLGLIRLPSTAGGGCLWVARASQSLRSLVLTLSDHVASAWSTAGISRSAPRPLCDDRATKGEPLSWGSLSSAIRVSLARRACGSVSRSHLAAT